MKILAPYFDFEGRSIDDPVVTGGIECFVRDLRKCIPEVIAPEVPFTLRGQSNALLEFMYQTVCKHEPDIVICNFPNSCFNTGLAKRVDVPIMWVCHHTAGFMSSLGSVGKMAEWARAGNTLWFVSEYQHRKWDELAERTDAGKLEVAGYIVPAVVHEKRELLTLDRTSWDCSTVGRCEPTPDKNPFLLHYRTKDESLRTLVMSNKKDNKYYVDNADWQKKYPQKYTMWNLAHDRVMREIAASRSFFVSWPDETFGIIALEALSCGVPIICNAKMRFDGTHDHASAAIPVKKEHCRLVSTRKGAGTVVAIREFGKMGDDFRHEILNLTWERYGVDAWRRSIYNSVDKAIELSKSRAQRPTVMEMFS